MRVPVLASCSRVHCKGAKLAPQLDDVEFDAVIHKGTSIDVDSYSGFLDNDQTTATELEKVLRDAGITAVVVCGLALDVCVRATALDAKRLGFDTTVNVAASRAAVPSARESVLAELRKQSIVIEGDDETAAVAVESSETI